MQRTASVSSTASTSSNSSLPEEFLRYDSLDLLYNVLQDKPSTIQSSQHTPSVTSSVPLQRFTDVSTAEHSLNERQVEEQFQRALKYFNGRMERERVPEGLTRMLQSLSLSQDL